MPVVTTPFPATPTERPASLQHYPLDAIPLAVYATDDAGRVTAFNARVAELCGDTLRIGERFPRRGAEPRWFAPDESPLGHESSSVARCLAQHHECREDVMLERADGTRTPVQIVATPRFDARGNVSGSIVALVALPDRDAVSRQLDEELAAARRLQSVSVELLQTGNLDALYRKVMDAAVELTGSDFASMQMLIPDRTDGRSELLLLAHRGFSEAAAEAWKWVPADRPCICGEALRTGERVVVPDFETCAFIAGTPELETYRQAGIRAAQSTLLRSRSGRIVGMISTHWNRPHRPADRALRLLDVLARQAADLIERAQAEEALRRQTERLHLLCEAAAVMLAADDPDRMLQELLARIGPDLGVDMYFNYMVGDEGLSLRLASCAGVPDAVAASLSRLEPGQAYCGAVALERQPIVAGHIQQSDDPRAALVRPLGIRAYACNPLLAGDRLLGTLSFASRTRDRFDPDDVSFLATMCRFVTVAYERLRLMQALREQDRRKDKFLATLAHELRNPLAPLRTAVQTLRLRGNETDEVRRGREIMERQVEHLTQLVDDLLDVSRITSDKLELRRRRVALSEIVHAAVESSRPHIEKRGHALRVELPPEPLHVEGDLVRLTQVFLNLLNNAAKYTEPGGRIVLAAAREGEQVVVRVRDSGIGIPAARMPRLFDMFYQAEDAGNRSQDGLGIGLALVRRLVELHGGSVEARSEGAGKGSEFTVRFPVVSAPEDAASRPAQAAAAPSGARRVLVVDDNRDAADSLAALLRLLGHDVHTAYDGEDGLRAAERLDPGLVLLDLGMPGLDGEEVCRRIRAGDRARRARLVALTGWGQEADRRRTAAAGFDHHLTKPVDTGVLLELMAALPD